MAKNDNLHKAKDAKNDEFYTRIEDVAEELRHYKKHFAGKVVFCNCDDPTWSAFWRYFHLNFAELGLKKLISTHYDHTEPTYKMEYEGGDDNDVEVGVKTLLEGNGDFRSKECLDLLDESDIVVTNPPFSLFREYVGTLMQHGKKFLIIGNKNAITYKEFFPLLKENKVWIGYSSPSEFDTPNGITKKINGLTRWFTNLDIQKRHEKLILWQRYYDDDGNPLFLLSLTLEKLRSFWWKSTSHICGVSCKAEHQRQQPSRLYKTMRSFASCGWAFFFAQKTKINIVKSLAHLCESDIITLIR